MFVHIVRAGVLSAVALLLSAAPAEAFGRHPTTSCTTTAVYCYPSYCDPCHQHWDPCHHHCQYWYPCHYHCYPCWCPCWPWHHHHHCYCIAYRDPYAQKGAVWVRCDSCTGCTPGWHYCYVYLTGKYEWVKVYRCYTTGTYDKEAEQAEGFQKAEAEMTGPAVVAATVPAGAKVTINGTPMPESTATFRRFQTPEPLAAGQKAAYEFVVEYVKDGRVVTSKRQVTLRPAEELELKFDEQPATTLAAK